MNASTTILSLFAIAMFVVIGVKSPDVAQESTVADAPAASEAPLPEPLLQLCKAEFGDILTESSLGGPSIFAP